MPMWKHPFRQQSDFWYLTGLENRRRWPLFLPHCRSTPSFWFVERRILPRRSWNGFRWGCEGAVPEQFGADSRPSPPGAGGAAGGLSQGAEGSLPIGRHPDVRPLLAGRLGRSSTVPAATGQAALPGGTLARSLHAAATGSLRWNSSDAPGRKISAEAHERARQAGAAGPQMSGRCKRGSSNTSWSRGARGPA